MAEVILMQLSEDQYDQIIQNIAKKLKQARKERKLTVLELSSRSGVADNHISFIENGKRTKVSLKVYLKICAGLNISPKELLEDIDQFPPFDD